MPDAVPDAVGCRGKRVLGLVGRSACACGGRSTAWLERTRLLIEGHVDRPVAAHELAGSLAGSLAGRPVVPCGARRQGTSAQSAPKQDGPIRIPS